MILIGCWRFMGMPTQNGVVTVGNNEITLCEFTKANKSQISETTHGSDYSSVSEHRRECIQSVRMILSHRTIAYYFCCSYQLVHPLLTPAQPERHAASGAGLNSRKKKRCAGLCPSYFYLVALCWHAQSS